jgi:hypothetical protein
MKSCIKILIILLSIATLKSQAQDIHFSQFYTQDWLMNPAKVGFFEGDYKLSAAYKSQWNSVTNAYQTFAASGEMSWVMKGTNRNILGMECHAYSDKAGDAGYTTNNVGINIAYTFCLDRFRSHFLSFGSGISYVNNFFDLSKLHFDNEYFGITNMEKFSSTNANYGDVDEGVEYNYIPSKLFSGFNYTISYSYSLYPRVMVDVQGPQKEINVGSFIGIRLDKEKEDEKYRLYFGSWYRVGDAYVAVVRMDMDNMSIGISYDVNVSRLYIASEGRGGPEFTITYNGFLPHTLNKKVSCPRF